MKIVNRPLVLVVEDDPWLAEHMTTTLEGAEFRAVSCAQAIEAIDLVDELQPAAIILDIMLPGVTGFSLLHELQSYADTASLPVVLCTSLADDLQLRELSSYGVRRLLDKLTMTPEDIVAAARSVLT